MTETVSISPEIWKLILAECTNQACTDILGCSQHAPKNQRRRYLVESPWQDKPQLFLRAAREISRERWADYPDAIPAPIAIETLEALAYARIGQLAPTPKPQPLTAELVIATIQEWTDAGKSAPTDADLAKALHTTPAKVHKILWYVRDAVERRPPDPEIPGTYHIIPIPEVTISYMSQEEIAAKYGAPRPKAEADRIRALTESRVENLGTTTLSNPDQEQREIERQAESNVWQAPKREEPTEEPEVTEMGAGRPPVYSWPPYGELIERYDALKREGKNTVAVLCDEFHCSRSTLDRQIHIARKAVERQDAEATQTIGTREPETSEPEEQAEQESADALTFDGPPLTVEQTGQLWDVLGAAYTDWKVVPVPETDKYMAWHLDSPDGCETGTWEEIIEMLESAVRPQAAEPKQLADDDGMMAKAEDPAILEIKTEYLNITLEFPAPCLVLLDDTNTRMVELDAGTSYLPDVGDQWPEIHTVNGKRRVQTWHCVRATEHQKTGAAVRVMVPGYGVELKPEVA